MAVQLTPSDFEKVLETILQMLREDSAVTNREVFRAELRGYINGILGNVRYEGATNK